MDVKQTVLPNGLKVVLAPMEAESVTVLLMVRVGSRDESAKLNGISHFFEHMVFKGTKKWPSAMAVNRVIDSVGGAFNAFTGQEHTGFWVKLAKKHLKLGLEFVNQLVFHSLLPGEELEKERGVILEEIKMNEDNPMRHVYDRFVSQVYSTTALGRPIIGSPENIKSVQRQDFVRHLASWYQPPNMVLALAGGIDNDVSKLAEEIFTDDKVGPCHQVTKSDLFRQSRPEVNLITKDIQQLHFCLGLTTFSRTHPQRYVLGLLSLILGGNTSSRLWEEIREKRGLVYYVGSSTDSFVDSGYLVLRAGCDVNRGEEAIKVALHELRKMAGKISPAELTNAQEYIKGHIALDLEDSQEVADLFGEDLLMEDKIRTIKEIVKKIEAVTAAQIQALAKKLLSGRELNLTVLGPVTNEQKFAKLLA